MEEEKNKTRYDLWIIGGCAIVLLAFLMCTNRNNIKGEDSYLDTTTITIESSRMDFVKRTMTDEYCRKLIKKAVMERFDVDPDAIVIEWKDLKEKESDVAGSFLTDWVYKKDKNVKRFYVKIHVTGDSCEHAKLIDATVSSINTDEYSSVKKIYEISDGKEVKIRMKPGGVISIGGVKVEMAAQHYPVQEFYTSRKLTRSQIQQVWEHEDRAPACNILQFRLPNKSRYDWYAELEEKSLYFKEANADLDQWYEITKNGKNWSYKRVRL
ncbi:MAG: hypothetical protein J5720_09060 [Bacteroidaceae bacterium]|nr:hypothetical protein [Bacteroidaceae bacterium]